MPINYSNEMLTIGLLSWLFGQDFAIFKESSLHVVVISESFREDQLCSFFIKTPPAASSTTKIRTNVLRSAAGSMKSRLLESSDQSAGKLKFSKVS